MKVIDYWYRHFGWLPYIFVKFLSYWVNIPQEITYILGLLAISWIIFVFYMVGFRDQG